MEEAEALRIEQERAALDERRNALISQRVAIQEAETELLAAAAQGEQQKVSELNAEIEVRRESLELQRLGILSEEEAAAIALERFRSREAIALQDRAQEQLNRQLIAQADREGELARAELEKNQLNQELMEEEAIRRRNLETTLANVRATQAQAAAEAEATEAGALKGAGYAARRGVAGALGIGVRALAGGIPQIAAFIALSEVVKALADLWKSVHQEAAAARAEQEKFVASLDALHNAKTDLAAIRQGVIDSRTAMAEFAEVAERQNRALASVLQLEKEAISARQAKNAAEEKLRIAGIEGDSNASDAEKAARIFAEREKGMADKQKGEQDKYTAEIGNAGDRRIEAMKRREEAEGTQGDLEDEIKDKTRKMKVAALLAERDVALGPGGAQAAKQLADEATALQKEIDGLNSKYKQQEETVEKARDQEQKIEEETAAQVKLCSRRRNRARTCMMQKKVAEAEEKHRQEQAEKKTAKEMSGEREKEINAALGALPQSADEARAAAADLVQGRLPGDAQRSPEESAQPAIH